MRWWLSLLVLLLAVHPVHAQEPDERVPPQIDIDLTVTLSGDLLRPGEGSYPNRARSEATALLDVRVTCTPMPVVILPYEGELVLELHSHIFTNASFSDTDPGVKELRVPLPFDLKTCDPSSPWSRSYEISYYMAGSGIDVLQRLDYRVEAEYGKPDEMFSQADATSRWQEIAGGFIQEVDIFMGQSLIEPAGGDRWRLEDVKLVIQVNGLVTIEGIIQEPPAHGEIWFDPPKLVAQEKYFSDPIRTFWEGEGDAQHLRSVRLAYRVTMEADPEVALVFQHPGLGPLQPDDWIQIVDDDPEEASSIPTFLILTGLLALARAVRCDRRGSR